MSAYKILDQNGRSYNGGRAKWSLPVKQADGSWKPGHWMPTVRGELEMGKNGYHLVDAEHLLDWAGPCLFEAEYRGDVLSDDDKICARQARLLRQVEAWNEQTLRLFAVWCAREALKLIEHPDPRSVNAVDVAERYANGQVTNEELAAAYAAARDAARDASRDAIWTAAWDTAWDAAMTTAWTAARATAWDAAMTTAWTAARATAWDAVMAIAWEAARKAAREVPWDTAWDDVSGGPVTDAYVTARDVARDAEYKKLFEMLRIEGQP